ncbi:hypothetical protein BT63DRAFT_453935 [Microthyrium microscopicum]|uniref:ABM domain-containing protein n=1 Tax=Microthyrium microscopicum TaxID=703497 RepID=A0A6A6UGZ9_9PEZI|nr:hypothetical protein BT63DRAFT_453935 [Microthyrium microscopicum]
MPTNISHPTYQPLHINNQAKQFPFQKNTRTSHVLPTIKMPPFICVGKISPKTPSARQQFITTFESVIAHTTAHEPDVTKYALTVPLDEPDSLALYIIEEYKSQASFDAHVKTAPVLALIKTISDQSIQTSPVHVTMADPLLGVDRPTVSSFSDPLVFWAHITYPDVYTRGDALKGWKNCVEYAQGNEPETGMYMILQDREARTSIRVLEAFTGEKAWKENHRFSDVVVRHVAAEGVRGAKVDVVRLRKIAGFLGR